MATRVQVVSATSFISRFTLAIHGRADFGEVLSQLSDLLDARGAALFRAVGDTGTLREIARSKTQDSLRWIVKPDRLCDLASGTVQLLAAPEDDSAILMMVLSQEENQADLVFIRFAAAPSEQMQRYVASLAAAAAAVWADRDIRQIAALTGLKSYADRAQERQIAEKALLGEDNAFGLSRSEFRVCNLLRKGLKSRQIADELGVSITTVRTHLRGIYSKTGLSGQFEVLLKLGEDAIHSHQTFQERLNASAHGPEKRVR